MRSKRESVMATNEKSLGAEPRLRFPAFGEAWEPRRLGDIADIYKGKGISKSDISDNGIHQCIRYGELYTVYGEVITEVISKTSLPAEDLFFSNSNDVIIPSSGETKEDIATAACVVPKGVALGGDLNILRSQEIGTFLSYYVNGPLRSDISRVAQGNSVVHLYPRQLEELWISLPSRDEQQKVADFLLGLDTGIGAETRKLVALKAYKQGLMQLLFPADGQKLPCLRFPGFKGQWKEAKGGSLFSNRLEVGE
jgi:type I restriction enzyme S subunit